MHFLANRGLQLLQQLLLYPCTETEMETEMSMTDLEMKLMNEFARCEMNEINGAVPESASDVFTHLWADERAAALGISEQAVGGLLTSLAKKGFCVVLKQNRYEPDGGFEFTEAGFEAWNADDRADKA